jgi:hypothetical protein
MIVVNQDGRQFLHYADWTPEMMALSHRLADLPRRPGATGRSTHALGVDRLHNDNRGRDRLALWLMARAVDAFEWCPDEEEVVQAGRALLTLQFELVEFYQARDRNRQVFRDRRATKVPRGAIESDRRHDGPTPIFGFRRGPLAGGGPKQS